MTLHKRWIDTAPLIKEGHRPTVRMPLSVFTKRGNAPPGDSYWPEYRADLCRNPHHPLNIKPQRRIR